MRRKIRIQGCNVRVADGVRAVIEINGIAEEMMLLLRSHTALDTPYHLLPQHIERWKFACILLEMLQNKKVDF